MKVRTLLPPQNGSSNGHRQELLGDDVGRFQVRARVLLTQGEEELLRLRLWAKELGWAALVLSEVGDVVALAVEDTDSGAWEAAKTTTLHKGYELLSDEFRTLFSPKWSEGGSRRSARLFDAFEEEDAEYQVSSKVLVNEEGAEFLQLRLWLSGPGWVGVVLNDVGDVVAHTVATTEKEAWKAAQAVMRRKGYMD